MPRWRIVVHALDRTGPPMLARAFLRWLRANEPTHAFDVVAFRGGELLDDFVRMCPVRVVLDPSEPWDWRDPDAARVAQLAPRFDGMPGVDATLLVSVAGAQAFPFLPPDTCDPIVTWSVEQGDDLHDGADARTHHWLAGSTGTRDELRARLPAGTDVRLVPEFVEWPDAPSDAVRAHCRTALGADPGDLLVVGAGIATIRKAPDLFLEIALAHQRRHPADATRFVWLGGEQDPFFHTVRHEALRLGVDNLRLFGNVVDVVPFLAAADVFLHPARLDAFPLVCLHAAGVGTPVVAFSGAGGVPEMLGDAFFGAPFPDVAALGACVEDLAHEARRAEVGAAQRESVIGRFTVETGGPAVLAQLLAATSQAAKAT